MAYRSLVLVYASILALEAIHTYVFEGPCLNVSTSLGHNSCVFFPEERVPWRAAHTVCSMYGGRFIRIQSSQDSNSIHSALQQLTVHEEPWIGIILKIKSWRWLSGQSIYSTVLYNGSFENLTWISERTPSLCAPNCFSQAFKYAVQKENDCYCSNACISWSCDVKLTDSYNSSGNQSLMDETGYSLDRTHNSKNSKVYFKYGQKDDFNIEWGDLLNPYKSCGILRISPSSYHVSAEDCNKKVRFICGTEDGKLEPVSAETLTFFEARRECGSSGRDLFRINSKNPQVSGLRPGDYWIGLVRFSLESYTGEPSKYQAFKSFSSLYSEDCIFVSPLSNVGQWYTADCTQRKRPLCIKEINTYFKQADDELDTASEIRITNTTELIVSEKANTWYNIESLCDQNSHVGTIKDRTVNELVLDRLRHLKIWDKVWIGGSITQRYWSTVSGSPLYFLRGCCTGEKIVNAININYNNLIRCMAHCAQSSFKYVYIQMDTCGCSNVTCDLGPADKCGDRCPDTGQLSENCGNQKDDLYSVYEENALDLPVWNPNDKFRGCGALEKTSTSTQLISDYCGNNHHYLCDTGIEVRHDGINTPKPWLKAREECRRNGRDLAVLYNNNTFLNSLPEGTYWLGMSQVDLRWYTGEAMIFTDFLQSLDNVVGYCISLQAQASYWIAEKCNDHNKAMCFRESMGSSLAPTVSIPSTTSTQSTLISKPSTVVSIPPTSNLTLQTSPVNSTMSSSKPNFSRPWVAVGITLGVALLLFAAAISVLMHRRNRRSKNYGCNLKLVTNIPPAVRYNRTLEVIESV